MCGFVNYIYTDFIYLSYNCGPDIAAAPCRIKLFKKGIAGAIPFRLNLKLLCVKDGGFAGRLKLWFFALK